MPISEQVLKRLKSPNMIAFMVTLLAASILFLTQIPTLNIVCISAISGLLVKGISALFNHYSVQTIEPKPKAVGSQSNAAEVKPKSTPKPTPQARAKPKAKAKAQSRAKSQARAKPQARAKAQSIAKYVRPKLLVPTLSAEALKLVDSLRLQSQKDKQYFIYDGQTLLGKNFRTLADGQWLDDEVINAYAKLINARQDLGYTPVKSYMFNSFFYDKLAYPNFDYDKVRRWTRPNGKQNRKPHLFDYDYVMMPINVNNMHWAFAVINFKSKQFEVYDSLAGTANADKIVKNLESYIALEAKDKGFQLNLSAWKKHVPGNKVPQQDNGVDCGVFTLVYAHQKSLDKDFDFSQNDIAHARRAITWQLSQGKLDEGMQSTKEAKATTQRRRRP